MTIEAVFAALQGPFGSLLLLLFAVLAFWKEWVIPGPAFRRVLRERDEARTLAYRSLGLSEKIVAKREQAEDDG